MAFNSVIDKGKLRYKILYKLLKEEYRYDILNYISTYPKWIHLKYFIGGINNCVTVVGKLVFDIDLTFTLPLTKVIWMTFELMITKQKKQFSQMSIGRNYVRPKRE